MMRRVKTRILHNNGYVAFNKHCVGYVTRNYFVILTDNAIKTHVMSTGCGTNRTEIRAGLAIFKKEGELKLSINVRCVLNTYRFM